MARMARDSHGDGEQHGEPEPQPGNRVMCDTRSTPALTATEPNPALDMSGPWQVASVHDLDAARELLDQLEQDGHAERKVLVRDDSSCIVSWR